MKSDVWSPLVDFTSTDDRFMPIITLTAPIVIVYIYFTSSAIVDIVGCGMLSEE
jgi:hypothetical protein